MWTLDVFCKPHLKKTYSNTSCLGLLWSCSRLFFSWTSCKHDAKQLTFCKFTFIWSSNPENDFLVIYWLEILQVLKQKILCFFKILYFFLSTCHKWLIWWQHIANGKSKAASITWLTSYSHALGAWLDQPPTYWHGSWSVQACIELHYKRSCIFSLKGTQYQLTS